MSTHQNDVRVLYVEDDPQASELLDKLLRLKYPHVSFYTAGNGEEGLQAFKDHRPHLVVTDINMPGTNGIAMAREIKKLDPQVVLIAVSAYHDGEYYNEASDVGFLQYITKPVEYRKLLEAIDKGLELAGNKEKGLRP